MNSDSNQRVTDVGRSSCRLWRWVERFVRLASPCFTCRISTCNEQIWRFGVWLLWFTDVYYLCLLMFTCCRFCLWEDLSFCGLLGVGGFSKVELWQHMAPRMQPLRLLRLSLRLPLSLPLSVVSVSVTALSVRSRAAHMP